jgi:hypothetical protein
VPTIYSCCEVLLKLEFDGTYLDMIESAITGRFVHDKYDGYNMFWLPKTETDEQT